MGFLTVHCPHCQKDLPEIPKKWKHAAPWQCSHCSGLYGVDLRGPFLINDDVKPLSPLLGFHIARRWVFYAGNYYTYALCRPNGLPFYVGSGYGMRALSHLAEAYRTPPDKRTAKHLEILDIESTNDSVMFHFLGLFESRDQATVMENYYIELYGRRSTGGILTNTSGCQKVDCDFPLDHMGFPEEPEIIHHPDHAGKWKHSIRVFHHPDIVVPPPTSAAIVTGAVMNCPACGVLGQYMRAMDDQKLLCSNCGHYFLDGQPENGKMRKYFGYPDAPPAQT